MNLRCLFVMFLGLQACPPAIAGPLFKCEVNGRVEFSDRRCQPVQATCPEIQTVSSTTGNHRPK